MCGIAGIVNFRNTVDNINIVNSMLTRIKHRGPDESGIYADQNATIGNVRLSIIDIKSGQQPLCEASERYWIVYNGELFNYIELRDDLKKKGYSFKTNSDTEVIVNLYAEYGKDALNYMNGQFAIAIWDQQTKNLFLARDRVGIRPFYYHYSNKVFTFGSEVKAVYENPSIERKINNKALKQVFTLWTTITPETVFEGISELSPGCYMEVTENGISEQKKYWELNFDRVEDKYKSIDEAHEEFNSIFTDAVKIRLRADVEVAAYLSGGIDSSIITSYVKEIEPNVLNTFSIGFKDPNYDESKYQNEVSKFLDTRHRSNECNNLSIANDFSNVIWHCETPIIRTAPAPMYQLSRLVRESDIKVVLTGEGADEIFAGYNIFKEAEIKRFWARQPKSYIRPLLLKKLYPYIPQMKNASAAMLKLFFGYKLEDTDNPLYSHLLRWNNTRRICQHFNDEIKNETSDYSPIEDVVRLLPKNFKNWKGLQQAQWLETSVFMSGYLLSSQGDRMGMGNSIEGRYPFLDHRVIEFGAKLPLRYKLNGLNEKQLLKKVIFGKIPKSVIQRSKQAYRAPISDAFLNDNAPEYIKDLLSKEMFDKVNIFNYDTLNPLFEKMKAQELTSEIDNMTLVGVISSHLLYHHFIENSKGALKESELLNSRIIRR
ncbi:asparagine synthase (glutamine-hydrolyzing) [Bacteroidales bacterium]|nr:asparagine synthase (glutamine-hydrolyzing) [Bacteroidales bacterium]